MQEDGRPVYIREWEERNKPVEDLLGQESLFPDLVPPVTDPPQKKPPSDQLSLF